VRRRTMKNWRLPREITGETESTFQNGLAASPDR
jgi:hypothetical protein